MPPAVGVSLMLEPAFARSTLPLFEEGLVDAIEWSFDVAWRGVPDWAESLLQEMAGVGRLYGHGVHFSALSSELTARQEAWLGSLSSEATRHEYRYVSEHFGFSTAGTVVQGAPMPVPFCSGAIAAGRRHLAKMAEAARRPIGLENLALAFSRRDALEQGTFVEALLAPDGFVVLDLHNLWCQSLNFEIPFEDLLATWPLERVRELHVSGGRWSTPQSDPRSFRRDTHDNPVPDEVLAFLPRALGACPAVEVVIVERLGTTFATPRDEESFREDVRRVRDAVRIPAGGAIPRALRPVPLEAGTPALAAWQEALLDRAASSLAPGAMRAQFLANREIAPLSPWLEEIEPRGLEIAAELSRTWARRSGESG